MPAPPGNLVGVTGHQGIQRRLLAAIAREQLHHALIFAGPEGVGKATTARGVACALHCSEQPGQGCGHCSACRRIMSGLHAGVEIIAPEEPGKAIKVEVTRDLGSRLLHAPFEGSAHVVILDPADAINEQASNALLKTIEEPRPGVCLILVTTNHRALLPTIVSRCMTLRFGRLSNEHVHSIVVEQDPKLANAAGLELAVQLADGSVSTALQLLAEDRLAPAVAFVKAASDAAQKGPSEIFGGERNPLWTAWAAATAGPNTGKPARERAAARRTARLWLLHLREQLRGNPGILPPDRNEPRVIVEQLRIINDFGRGLEQNPNVRLHLERTLLSLHELR